MAGCEKERDDGMGLGSSSKVRSPLPPRPLPLCIRHQGQASALFCFCCWNPLGAHCSPFHNKSRRCCASREQIEEFCQDQACEWTVRAPALPESRTRITNHATSNTSSTHDFINLRHTLLRLQALSNHVGKNFFRRHTNHEG